MMKSLLFVLSVASLALAARAGDGKQAPPAAGERLWAQTCVKCHPLHPPTTYSDAQWSVVMQHMRTRAYLTGAEARAVLEYLQSAN
jgi:mono/diheme cytochrome c family protein